MARVLRARAVRAVVAAEARTSTTSYRPGLLQARKYAFEIAANYSHAFVQIAEKLLGRVWNRVYDGVKFNHAETLKQVSRGQRGGLRALPPQPHGLPAAVVRHLPPGLRAAAHRRGHQPEHPGGGPLPAQGRRVLHPPHASRGNALYTVVFMKYLAAIMARGHSIEYFIEGGRSRTGRLLHPKTGMLSMTVRSFLRDPVRPVVFVPVYFGYERIVEANTYISRAVGRAQEEGELARPADCRCGCCASASARCTSMWASPSGSTTCSTRSCRAWREQRFDDDTRLPAVNALVGELALSHHARHQRGGGGHAHQPAGHGAARHPARRAARQRAAAPARPVPEAAARLRRTAPRVTVTDATPAEIVEYGESLKIISRVPHKLGDIVKMSDESAQLIAYYRNNVLHLFALPSLVACAFIGNSMLRTEDIQRLAWRIYPYVASELFLRWREDELATRGRRRSCCARRARRAATQRRSQRLDAPAARLAGRHAAVDAARRRPSRPSSATTSRSRCCSRPAAARSTQKALEQQCQLAAQRMNMLYGFNSPEFFDRALFENFIDLLRERGVIRAGEGGNLEFDEVLVRVAADAQLVLSEQIRHSILQVTQV